jgi:hypothetical protein
MLEGLVGAAVGAILSGFITWWLERRKARKENDRQRTKTAYEACQRLHELLGDWYNEIAKATKFEASPSATLEKLSEFNDRVHFDSRVGNQVALLKPERLCEALIKMTNAFAKGAYKEKGWIKIGFESEFNRRNYDASRDEALQYLKGHLRTFEDELHRITPLLQQKAKLVS